MNGADEHIETRASAPNRVRIVRTALILAAVAVSFYVGFIALGVMRG